MSPRPAALVVRALGLGDLVTGLPALRLLRDTLLAHRVVLATPGHWRPIVERAGTVDALLDAGELLPLRGAPQRPDVAIDLHGNGPASRDVLAPCAPRRLVAYADGRVTWRHAEHEVARWCRLLREGLPIAGLPAPGPDDPPVTGVLGEPPDCGEVRGVVVVHCGAASPSRRWPPERFAAVARTLSREGHRVVVTGGAGESALARQIAEAAGVAAQTTLSLTQLLDLVGHAELVVCGDTGVAHLASAYGIASVTLFGPVAPSRWGPPPLARHRVLWHGDDSGDPHGQDLDPALARITVAEVLTAAGQALAADR